MKFVVALVFLFAAATARSAPELAKFTEFVAQFEKVYEDDAEFQFRFDVFRANVAEHERHNSQDGVAYKKGINRFTDMTDEEFRSTLNGFVNLKQDDRPVPQPSKAKAGAAVSHDWRDFNVITPVKDQGNCGSCWAHATSQSIESYAAINNNTLVELSTQQITSCTPNTLQCGGSGGCAGSIPQLGFTYTQLMGVMTEADYPYVSGSIGDTACTWDSSSQSASAKVRGYEKLPQNNYDAIMYHVEHIGPLSVSVDASTWSSYSTGVFTGCSYAENIAINHAVQLVGFGTDVIFGDYWLVRNSWGPSYGEAGYIRLQRDAGATQCGTDSTPLVGTACVNDGQSTQMVCGQCGVLFDVTYPIGAYLM